MDRDIANRFSPYLSPGEVIRWTGRPMQGIAFRFIDMFLVPFSLLWCGLAINWEYGVASDFGGPSFMLIWGGMFVCIGLYFVFGRFIGDAFLRSQTFYALTDRRALLLGGLNGRSLTSVNLFAVGEIRYADSMGGRGTISFGPDLGFGFNRQKGWHASTSGMPQFFRARDAASAYKLIQTAKRAGP